MRLSSCFGLAVPAIVALFLCAACGGKSPSSSSTDSLPPPPTVSAVSVTPANPTAVTGSTAQLTATATYSDATTSDVTSSAAWSTSASGIATVSGSGVVTAIAVGTSTISAKLGSISGSTVLTVTAPATATLVSIAVTPASVTINKSSTQQYIATATYSDGTTGNVSGSALWSSSATGIASISVAGLATGLAAGTTTIGAKVGNVSGSTTLTVTAAATLTAITVTPPNRTLSQYGTQQFSATASYSDGTSGDVTSTSAWTSSSTTVATISPVGLATAVGVGSTIIASKIGSISGSTGLTVQASSTTHTSVLTYKNDLSRTGLNATESILTTANVKSATFGLKFKLSSDGVVFSQPLYAAQVSISGALHNIVYFVTEHNSAYAYDADTGALMWRVSLGLTGETTSDDRGCNQVSPEIGATATPVIDRSMGSSGTMYLIAMSKDASGVYHQRLHALDLASGAELFGGPREIQATYPTHGGGTTTFDPSQYKERSGLVALNGEIYTTWTSHCDDDPYTGWILAYNESALAQTRVFNIAPNSAGFGPSIWMSGGAPAVDSAGNLYITAANGVFETTMDVNGFPSLQDYGNTFLKISTANQTLAVTDYFTMWNEVSESNADLDLGGGGPLLLPDLTDSTGTVKHLALAAGKDAIVYVVDRDSMGRFNSSTNNIWQELDGAVAAAVKSTPAYFNGHVYLSDRDHSLKSFSLSNAKLPTSPTSQTTATFVYPGASPIVSSNGTTNGIVWAADSANPSVLHAYDATNLATELYNSTQAAAGRDSFGAGGKYVPATVADGKVFVVAKTQIAVFGLLQ